VLTSAELREAFLSFYEEKGHLRVPSHSLVPPPEDQSTLFVVAGMQPFKPYFLGEKAPPGPRATSAQKVLRAGGKDTDLEDVGRTDRHCSFFEMLGNFSFGDYFKDEAVDYAWEFVTERLGLDPALLWATVHEGDPTLGLGEDSVAIDAWKRVGMPPERIVRLGKDNFWQAAETGPCGPCSEIFFDRGEGVGCRLPLAECGPGHCDRFMEIYNLVFMQYDLRPGNELVELPNQNIDTGMGLERTSLVLQGVDSNFDTDGFQLIMRWVEEQSGVGYRDSAVATKAHRVLADHARAMAFLVAEGVTPSNEGRGYICRRIIRRAIQHGQRIGLDRIYRLPLVVVDQMGDAYPELRSHVDQIERVVKAEEERFAETLARGLKVFEELDGAAGISGENAFTLAATYGFPVELTVELAEERGQGVDVDRFAQLMEEHREISRAGGEQSEAQRAAAFAAGAGFTSEFVGFEKTDVLTQIGALEETGDGHFLAKLRESPFYAAGGGQVTDAGELIHEGSGAVATLKAAYRVGDDQALLFEGSGFTAGDRVRAVVPWSVRFPTMANHTATHLLHESLRQVLGEHVRQAGSAVRPDKLRFDFTHERALTPEERTEVERLVNEQVFRNAPVRIFETPIEEARNLGAQMLFGEKYGDVVRVVEIDGFSRELCGGTHVRSTAEIGPFAIVSEGSVGSGARRIEAVTSAEAFSLLQGRAREADELRAALEDARKQAKKGPATNGGGVGVTWRSRGDRWGIAEVRDVPAGALPDLADELRRGEKLMALVLGAVEEERVHLLASVDPNLDPWAGRAAGARRWRAPADATPRSCPRRSRLRMPGSGKPSGNEGARPRLRLRAHGSRRLRRHGNTRPAGRHRRTRGDRRRVAPARGARRGRGAGADRRRPAVDAARRAGRAGRGDRALRRRAPRRRLRPRRELRRALHDDARVARSVLAGTGGRARGRAPARELPRLE
jgi:alanyl-tRNA synthetase